jgi:predicted AlkP superfamily phosphohydrolase/phosphomutase
MPVYYPITGVWVNLRGRQPKGVVAPGAEYEALRDQLARELAGLRDPATGRPLLVGVWRREEVYQGPHCADAPDLLVQTVPGVHGGFDVERLLTDVPAASLRSVNGSHTPEGIFVAAGGPFRRGVALEPPSLADVLPTAVHLVGGTLPDDLDGRVIEDALDPEYVAAHRVRLAERRSGSDGREELSQDDEAEMKKFLQGLGYVE